MICDEECPGFYWTFAECKLFLPNLKSILPRRGDLTAYNPDTASSDHGASEILQLNNLLFISLLSDSSSLPP
jgi:hypothetical protein